MRTRWWVPITAAFVIVSSAPAADRSLEPVIWHIWREPVESSALAAVGYSKRLHALEIEFRDGLVYRSLEVPAPTYLELRSAPSKARFYNHHVRGKYRCVRVKAHHSQ